MDNEKMLPVPKVVLQFEFENLEQAALGIKLLETLKQPPIVSPPVDPPTKPPVPVVGISDVAGIRSALVKAKPGDVITLEGGRYASLALGNVRFADFGVTIRSKDLNNPAIVETIVLRDCMGLRFADIEVIAISAASHAIQVLDCAKISFSGLNVHGSLNDNPADDQPGMMIRSSQNISVSNSEFHELAIGISHLDNIGLTITGNDFHDIRADGIAGGGSSKVRLSGNKFTDFKPAIGDHPDGIQFWFRNAAVFDIEISSNLILRGDGGPMQGIFLTDQSGVTPYSDVRITDNVVSGGMGNGIMVLNAEGLELKDNVVAGFPDGKSWIRVAKAPKAVIGGNKAETYLIDEVDVVPAGNTKISAVSDKGKALADAWQAKR